MDALSLTPEEWTAIGLSLRVATVATLASLPLGILTALLLARGRFPGKSLVDALVHLPLVLPPLSPATSSWSFSAAADRSAPGWNQPSASSSPSAGPVRRLPARSWASR